MRAKMDQPLFESLPYWFRDIPELQQITDTEQQAFEAALREMTAIGENFFFQTMDASAVEMWEEVLGIIPNPSTETLEFRRARVLNRVSTRPPYTLGFLYQKLDELIGPGQWEVTVDYPAYTLYIDSSAINQQWATEVAITIGRIKPCHIVYRSRPYTTDKLLLNEQIDLSRFRLNYRLGAWLLGSLPFGQEESLGVIKLPTQRSIQPQLLDDTAKSIEGMVAAARINGAVKITELTKAATGNALTVTFTVDQTQADAVSQVELLDAADQVLTASAVYVPITEQAIFRHTINVQEGIANG